ncbi:MAG: G5 domain-containing protein [Clostridia bacterium]|nr:G5 domain-containing protein [Clostridia bacterium]
MLYRIFNRIYNRIADFPASLAGRITLAAGLCAASVCLILFNSFVITEEKTYSADSAISLGVTVENFTADFRDEHYVLREVEDTPDVGTGALYFPVTVIDLGESITYLCAGETVSDFLTRTGYILLAGDTVTPALDSTLARGDIIRIRRVRTETVTVSEAIPFDTHYIHDKNLASGDTSVITTGINGQKKCTYSIVYENGKEVSRTLLSSTVTRKATTAVIRRGSTEEGGYITLSNGTVRRYTKIMRVQATAYNAANTVNITAVGTTPKWGTVAVDRRVIPLGTEIFVTSIDGSWSYGVGLCEDTGVIGNRVDLYMNSLEECYQFGRRDVYVYILAD